MDDTETRSEKDAEMSEGLRPTAAPILIPADRLKQTIPWILRDERYADDALDADLQRLFERDDFDAEEVFLLEEANKARFSGRWYGHALTDAQAQAIAEKFSFSEEAVQQLSRRLAHALNTEEAPVIISLSRERAETSAKKKMTEALGRMMRAGEEADKAFELLANLTAREAQDRVAANRFDKALKDHDKLLIWIERLCRRYAHLSGIAGLVLDLDIVDKRAVADLRRHRVLETMFRFWAEHGRRLSVTTDPDKSARKGPLVDFVNMVVRAVTAPPTELPGETIWRDLKTFKGNRPNV